MAADTRESAEAILRICSYRRQDLERLMIRSLPHETEALKESLQTAFFETESAARLQIFNRLPAELACMILSDLDLLSLWQFRQANRHARMLSTSLREYQLVTEYGFESLRGLLRSGLAPQVTIAALCKCLLTPECALCGAYGGFLFLPTTTRCCFACLQRSPATNVISLSELQYRARRNASWLRVELAPLLMHTVPGTYWPVAACWPDDGACQKRPLRLASMDAANAALQSRDPRRWANLPRGTAWYRAGVRRFMAATALPWFNVGAARLEHGVSCAGCTLRFETLHPAARDRSHDERDCMYSAAGFLTHFDQCEWARNLWMRSENGTMDVELPLFTRRGGYLSEEEAEGMFR